MTEQERTELIRQLRLAASYIGDLEGNRLVPKKLRSHQVERASGHIATALRLLTGKT